MYVLPLILHGPLQPGALEAMQVASLASDVEIDAQETINRLKIGVERGEV